MANYGIQRFYAIAQKSPCQPILWNFANYEFFLQTLNYLLLHHQAECLT